MNKIFLLLAGIFFSLQSFAFVPEIKTYTLSDGEEVLGRLCLPENGEFNTLVFVVHGTGMNTYLNMRSGFNYYDDLAEAFTERGVAFFSYDRRGVTIDENNPPFYCAVDSVRYLKYTPLREAEDIENMITILRQDNRVKDAKCILYGISEGTIIGPLVAERKNVDVDALFLHGYANENMYDVIEWQNSGAGVLVKINAVFDANHDKVISKEEYESDDQPLAATYRTTLFANLPFETVDVNNDGILDVLDIRQMRAAYTVMLIDKITEGDDEWIMKNYFPVTSTWYKAHMALEPNKSRLLRLNIPIHIFHGAHDANVPVEGVYDIKERFRVANKENLIVHIFEKHNHDLNYEVWLAKKKWPEGLLKIFDTAAEMFL